MSAISASFRTGAGAGVATGAGVDASRSQPAIEQTSKTESSSLRMGIMIASRSERGKISVRSMLNIFGRA
jgi:hypothetical protein